ncbi:MAG: formyltetrahydrofolate deformylase [Planctomycetia bacterium]|nr:formyltetrahydrofolate deformylase [Planctomycetia bacterium]
MPTHILLIDCPDETGLVHRITGVLCRHDCNIVANSEFVDRDKGHFFMRTEFSGEIDAGAIEREVRAVLPGGSAIRMADDVPRRVVVLATTEPHCLGDLLIRHEYGELNSKIVAVISNHAELGGLVGKFGLPFHHVSHEGLDRAAHEAAVLETLGRYAPEYIVLAKYMRVLSPAFVEKYPQRIINIHHSFLPAFAGAGPYRQAFERGVKIIGATAHYVNAGLDTGPIIAQDVISVNHSHTAADMALAGRDVEKIVLARALKLVFEERVFLSGNRTIIFE